MHRISNQKKLIILLIGLITVTLASIFLGVQNLSISELFTFSPKALLIFKLRFPRIITALVVGAIMALSGLVIQSVTGNNIADTSILGINSGAGLGVVIYYTLVDRGLVHGQMLLIILAIVGACGASIILFYLARDNGRINNQKLILNGIAIGVVFLAFSSLLALRLSYPTLSMYTTWTSGSIYGAKYQDLIFLIPTLVLSIGYMMSKHLVLDRLILGDELAASLGVEVKQEKFKLIMYTVLSVSICTAFSGPYAFIGMIIPNIIRKGFTNCSRFLIPATALCGSIFLILADDLSRTIFVNASVPSGMIAICLLAPLFFYVLKD